MKDFRGQPLKVDDCVAFVMPSTKRLTKGYVSGVRQDGCINVKFWCDIEWDHISLYKSSVVKITNNEQL